MPKQTAANGGIQDSPAHLSEMVSEKLTTANIKDVAATPSESDSRVGAANEAQAHTPPADDNGDEEYSIFPPATRTYLTYLLGFVMILSTLTATIYFPLIPMLSDAFEVSIQNINLTVTVYAILQAVAPGVFASLADTTGRRPVLLWLVALYAVASLGLALNRGSYAVLIALRAIQSIGGSLIPAIGYGVAADVSMIAERGKMLGPMLSFCNGLSALGLVVARAVANFTGGYLWVFLALLILSVVSFVLVGFTMPEMARAVVGNGSGQARGWRTWWSCLSSARKKQWRDVEGQATRASLGGKKKKPKRWPLSVLASLRIILHPDAAAVLWMVASSYCV